MSIESAFLRIGELHRALTGPTPPAAAPVSAPQPASTFAAALSQAQAPTAASSGERMLQIARQEVGQAEIAGSNNSPRIAEYRASVAGPHGENEPWCADFTSWVARQAGVPMGYAGGGFASVSALTTWAQETGRWQPASMPPQPGDLILFGTRHVGIVSAVNPDGTIATIEGNYRDGVGTAVHSPGEWTGFARPG